ncbi:hypothetical protein G6F56_014580 [Rhizopus delemar]|nr:hypothetical protein G6F24_018879 [Rhizopus arrhizus]KAG0916745.1 hypothetical protein G6F32_016490 [Rhizopus arrhizus]KAG1433546.1 hypothetical protein G6F56_014580 [Rhizopus delemar]
MAATPCWASRCQRWSLQVTWRGCAASCAPGSRTWAPGTAAWWRCSAPTAAASMPGWRWVKCAMAAATASC